MFDGDSFTLIKTKLKRPRANGDLLARPHLINSLNEGLNRKLTLISAPAGFGKTTLAIQWLSQLPADRPSSESVSLSAWLSLDQDDNDLVVFLAYFIAAVQTAYSEACAGVQEMLKAPQLPPVDILTSTLINELAELPDKLVLALDDYHVLDDEPV